MKATYQARIVAYGEADRCAGDAALSAYAGLYGRVERCLFAEMAAGRSAASLKSAYLNRCGIPARMFNALRVSLQGKVASIRESQKLRVDDLRRRIPRAKKKVARAAKDRRLDRAHHKRRRLANLEHRLQVSETELKAGVVRLCFGSKALWRRQYHLEANGYASHEEWLGDWRSARKCSGLRTSGVVLENNASFGSDYLRTKQPLGSHYLRMSANYLRRAHLVENDTEHAFRGA